MSLTSGCTPCACDNPVVVEIPGVEGEAGAPGADGTNGINAFTETTSIFVVPPVSSTVTVFVESSEWMAVGQNVFIASAGFFEVASAPVAPFTSVSLEYLDYDANVAAGNSIAAGSVVSPAGTEPALSAALPTALTDNTTGTASNTLAAGTGVFTLAIPITLVQITGAADVLTTYTPGYAFKILAVDARVVEVVTTGGDAASINLEIGAVNLTGGVVALTSANCTPLGAAIAGSAVTGNNTGTSADTISIEASSVTAFAEGAVLLLVKIQNLDTASSVASLAAKVNSLITALTP